MSYVIKLMGTMVIVVSMTLAMLLLQYGVTTQWEWARMVCAPPMVVCSVGLVLGLITLCGDVMGRDTP